MDDFKLVPKGATLIFSAHGVSLVQLGAQMSVMSVRAEGVSFALPKGL